MHGEKSGQRPVTSGILQGSALGPLLFLTLVNNLSECVTSDANIFAGDTKIFQIAMKDDNAKLQQDLSYIIGPTVDFSSFMQRCARVCLLVKRQNTWTENFKTELCKR